MDQSNSSFVIQGHVKDLGGFQVRRSLPSVDKKTIGPFIFWDHMGPATFPKGTGIDVRPHPHIGLATVTYLFEGSMLHRDSLGTVQVIQPGDVNWMTAGKGIVHSERTPEEIRKDSHSIHGIQSWVVLPKDFEDVEPDFFHHTKSSLPTWTEGNIEFVLIAGEFLSRKSPVHVFSPMFYVNAVFSAKSEFSFTLQDQELGVYVVQGTGTIRGTKIQAGDLFFSNENGSFQIVSDGPMHVLLLGGQALAEKHYIDWNFVSSDLQKIETAKQRWKTQEMGKVPSETEFIPLPEKK